VALLVAMAGLGACTRPVPSLPAAVHDDFALELAGEYIVPHGSTVGDERIAVGGVSGLVLDRRTGILFAVCDAHEPSRVFLFDVRGEGTSFSVGARGIIPLARAPGGPPVLDAEAIALVDDEIVIASEGSGDRNPRVPPAILTYTRTGRFVRSLRVPARFVPTATGPLTSGVLNNEAFESLTLAPSGTRLFTATESPIVQDGEAASVTHGALTRLIEYARAPDGNWEPRREFAYPIEPVAGGGFPPAFAINGVVELLALGDDDLLVLERSFVEERGGPRQMNRIRLYRVSLASAVDVSGVARLDESSGVLALSKRLVLDLDDVRGLSPSLAALDNFEGLAFGPRLADGSASLLMVSDDNFNPSQRTAFLLFRIVPAGRASTPLR
jgi:hypothetical protein